MMGGEDNTLGLITGSVMCQRKRVWWHTTAPEDDSSAVDIRRDVFPSDSPTNHSAVISRSFDTPRSPS